MAGNTTFQSGIYKSLPVILSDPLMGTSSVHGVTNNRPKAYSGEQIPCPWDKKYDNALLTYGESYIVVNDYPALMNLDSLIDTHKEEMSSLFNSRFGKGECLVIIYSHAHEGHWLTLSEQNQWDIIELWVNSSVRSNKLKGCKYSLIFENDGPLNSMPHPHGQQYNFYEIPPSVKSEISRARQYYKSNNKNLFSSLYEKEVEDASRIIVENRSYIAFIPPGAKWPYQVRILPRRNVTHLYDLSGTEREDLYLIITDVRLAYKRLFSGTYKPTIMMNILQAPYGNDDDLHKTFGFRVEFFNTALNVKAEKLMFSVENSTGYSIYSQRAEETAQQLRSVLADRMVSTINFWESP